MSGQHRFAMSHRGFRKNVDILIDLLGLQPGYR
jgi:hypothetical protein